MSGLRNRIDRLDGGSLVGRRMGDLTDAQLWRIVAAGQPRPADFLERVRSADESDVDAMLQKCVLE
jgi:hypothetical protein